MAIDVQEQQRLAQEYQAAIRAAPEHAKPDTAPIGALGKTPGVEKAVYIPPQDQGAWLPAWQLLLDWKGREYGRAVKLPVGQLPQLLQARWPDGRLCYTMNQPRLLEPMPTLPCIVVNGCNYKGFRRVDVVQHARACHPQESAPYREIFEEIERNVIHEDERARAMIESLKTAQDAPMEAVPSDGLPEVAVEEPQAELVEVQVEPATDFVVQAPPTGTAAFNVSVSDGTLSTGASFSDWHPQRIGTKPEPAPEPTVDLSGMKPKYCPWPGCDWPGTTSGRGLPLALGHHVANVHAGGA